VTSRIIVAAAPSDVRLSAKRNSCHLTSAEQDWSVKKHYRYFPERAAKIRLGATIFTAAAQPLEFSQRSEARPARIPLDAAARLWIIAMSATFHAQRTPICTALTFQVRSSLPMLK
jgi:hypothetical protein